MNIEKTLENWLRDPPADEAEETVRRVLVKYFGPDSVKKSGGSHQYRIKHPALADLPGFHPYGYLSIPVKSGQRVKGIYLKWIAQAIKHLEEAEERVE